MCHQTGGKSLRKDFEKERKNEYKEKYLSLLGKGPVIYLQLLYRVMLGKILVLYWSILGKGHRVVFCKTVIIILSFAV